MESNASNTPPEASSRPLRVRWIVDHFEQLPRARRRQQIEENSSEDLAAISTLPLPSVVNEAQRRAQPTVPPRPPKHPNQRNNPQPLPATQPTPPLTPERDGFQETGGRSPLPPFELGVGAQLRPSASIYSASPFRDAETQAHHTRLSPSPNDNTGALQQIQDELQVLKFEVRRLKNERAEHGQEVEALQTQLHNLELRYDHALQTAARNGAGLSALQTELDRVRVLEHASRGRARALEDDLRAAMERHMQLVDQQERLLLREETRARKRRSSGTGKSARSEERRHRQLKPQQGMGCFCM